MKSRQNSKEKTSHSGRSLATRTRAFGLGLAWFGFGTALLALVGGWLLGVRFFVRIFDAYPAMVPETALCVLIGSLGVALSYVFGYRWIKLICGAAIIVIVAIANFSHPFQTLIGTEDGMSIATALAILLLAATLISRSIPGDRSWWIAATFATIGLSLVTVPVMGYIFNAGALFSSPLYTEMALHTSVSLMALFLSLQMIEPDRGWMGVLTAPEHGSEMARKILPIIVLGPVVLTAFALFATRQQLVSADLRAAMLSYAMIFTTVAAAIYFAHLTNISERRAQQVDNKLRESEKARQATELAVVRSQKVEALGKLVGGVAHDFNNTLTVILGNLSLIQEDDDDENRRAIYVKEAITASNHAAQLTRQLLAYGRKSRLEPVHTTLDDLIQTTLSMFRRVCPANIVVSATLSAPDAVVRLDVANMQQALLNILINARDAQPDGGAIHVGLRVDDLSRETVIGFNEGERLPDGLYATVSVTDNGPGMPPETLARAAEPFFTTKGMDQGSGLGLSVVAGFCRQSGGGLKLSSTPGSGVQVLMAFPVVHVEAKGVPARDHISRSDGLKTGDILIVDDELQVTRVLARQLEFDGHRVRIAVNAERALAILAAEPLPDLVLSDLAMPGRMQGIALAQAILGSYPSIRVILMSGGDAARHHETRVTACNVPFLQKPLDREQLRALVQSALTEADHAALAERSGG